MSYCNCPQVPREQQEALLESFIKGAGTDWNLLKLQELYQVYKQADPSMTVEAFKQEISSTIPFRGGPCSRSLKCCAMCTRQCRTRCIQDCYNRVHMWRTMLSSTPEEQQPLALKLAVASVDAAKDLETISWVVGDVLSRKTNSSLREYMKNAGLRPEENPYKLDYAPQCEVSISEKTGKSIKKTAPGTGEVLIRHWPSSGLCPFCLPAITTKRKPGRGSAYRSTRDG